MLKRNKTEQAKPGQSILRIIISAAVITSILYFCYVMNYSQIIPILLLFLAIHLRYTNRAGTKLFIKLGLLLTVIVLITNLIVKFSSIQVFCIPVASIAMLSMLLFNNLHISFVMSLASSAIVTIILGGDFAMMFTFFLGSNIGAYSVKDSRTRGQLISAGLFVSVINVACLVLVSSTSFFFVDQGFIQNKLYPLIANGFISAFLVAATLNVFEFLFGELTNFSLLELSDFNQPLLKRMIMEAPGTYQHSLVVSNLAEAAADTIGKNSLLARVGAYYHDIGKMVKSEYFTENQLMGRNKHDNMEPSMSRLVILNHVKEGIELAKKHKLNQRIIDFIPQHHGTSLMYYFYQKSLEDSQDKETIKEEDYRYPGPKPQSWETAIVLLADSVEAATRSLDDPNPAKIEETVKKVINNKFIDGQFDECNLTLKEIDNISATFTRILSSMYHSRVKYPEKNDGSNSKKPTEKDSSQSSPDKQDS